MNSNICFGNLGRGSRRHSWHLGFRFTFGAVAVAVVLLTVLGCGAGSPFEKKFTLTVTKSGEGSYALRPTPGADGKYSQGAVVTIDTSPTGGWEAVGTVGPVTMDSDKAVTITFQKRYLLAISKTGEGSFTLNPPPGPDGKYSLGTVVTVKPSPGPGWELADEIQPITMDADRAAAVVFKVRTFALTVSQRGDGSYTLNPPPGPDGKYMPGAVVNVRASPSPGWETASPVPPVTMSSDKAIEIVFQKRLSLTVSQTGKGTYTLSPSPGTDGKYSPGTVVTIRPSPAQGWDLRAPVAPVPMATDSQVTIAFVIKPPQRITRNLPIGTGSGTERVQLTVGQRVEGDYRVAGADVTHRVQDPGGNIILSKNVKGQSGTFAFAAAQNGTYSVVFVSSGIVTPSVITLNLTIHYPE